jgi:regulation of enolase protein 1 (concanavalin A-like superfamily)
MAPAPSGDFSLSALVQVDFSGTFDAGSLFMRIDERFWAKLCFEFSPDREAMIVSVVNKEVSDDANGFTVEADRAHLRISRIGQAYAFHASTDGTTWRLIRAFALGRAHDALEIGFEAQSPHTQGCQVTFHNPTFHGAGLADLRDGS